jgi:hypothetical protein
VPNYSKKPTLNASDEEYKMLIEVCEEFQKQKTDKTTREESANPTATVLRNHLKIRNLNLSNTANPRTQGSKIKTDLLLLKNGVDPNQEDYPSSQVKMIIDVKNHGAAAKTFKNGKQQDPNRTLRLRFNELEATTGVKNFAVVVFSETLLLPKGPYKWRFKEDVIGKENCKVFTLVARQFYPAGGLYVKSNVETMLKMGQMKKTQELQKLINYLTCL